MEAEKAPKVRNSRFVFTPSFTHERGRAHKERAQLKWHTCVLFMEAKTRCRQSRVCAAGGSAVKGRHLRCKRSAWHAFKDRTRMRPNLAAITGPCFHSLSCQQREAVKLVYHILKSTREASEDSTDRTRESSLLLSAFSPSAKRKELTNTLAISANACNYREECSRRCCGIHA